VIKTFFSSFQFAQIIIDTSGANPGLDLRYLNLAGVNFAGSYLYGVDFTGATNVNFSQASVNQTTVFPDGRSPAGDVYCFDQPCSEAFPSNQPPYFTGTPYLTYSPATNNAMLHDWVGITDPDDGDTYTWTFTWKFWQYSADDFTITQILDEATCECQIPTSWDITAPDNGYVRLEVTLRDSNGNESFFSFDSF
jgi:hypothetical protein